MPDMRRIISSIWCEMGWFRMPKWLFVWMYVKPAMKSYLKEEE